MLIISSRTEQSTMLKRLALYSIAAVGAVSASQQIDNVAATDYWYASMDHTGDFRGKAPYVGDSYEVFKRVTVGDGKAIQDAIDSGDRHKQWLSSEPRVSSDVLNIHKSWANLYLSIGCLPTFGYLRSRKYHQPSHRYYSCRKRCRRKPIFRTFYIFIAYQHFKSLL